MTVTTEKLQQFVEQYEHDWKSLNAHCNLSIASFEVKNHADLQQRVLHSQNFNVIDNGLHNQSMLSIQRLSLDILQTYTHHVALIPKEANFP